MAKDFTVDVTAFEDRLAAVEAAVKVLQAPPAGVPVAIAAKMHELISRWNLLPLNGWRNIEDF